MLKFKTAPQLDGYFIFSKQSSGLEFVVGDVCAEKMYCIMIGENGEC